MRVFVLLFSFLVSSAFISCKSVWLYHPTDGAFELPASLGIRYDNVTFITSDGITLNGRYVYGNSKKATVLYCHGNGGNISWLIESYRMFNEMGFNLFAFDYRGYGLSGGEPSVEGTYEDVEAAWKYLTEERKTDPLMIVIWGRSMGGPIAAHCAAIHNAGAFVAESTFTSLRDEVSAFGSILPYIIWPGEGYDTIGNIRNVKCPVLVIHSPDDETVPFSMGRALYDAANEPKQFLEIKGSHNNGFFMTRDVYMNGVSSFVERYVRNK